MIFQKWIFSFFLRFWGFFCKFFKINVLNFFSYKMNLLIFQKTYEFFQFFQRFWEFSYKFWKMNATNFFVCLKWIYWFFRNSINYFNIFYALENFLRKIDSTNLLKFQKIFFLETISIFKNFFMFLNFFLQICKWK